MPEREFKPFAWQCSYCGRDTTVTKENVQFNDILHINKSVDGNRGVRLTWIVCPNPNCNRLTVTAELCDVFAAGYYYTGKALKTARFMPPSCAKATPPCVPAPIAQDYAEACEILDRSPKASATLSRRCLQGIIRDFHGISKARLVDEIEALKGLVDSEVWSAIDGLRKLGNIGAHMEKDINAIVDVDENEAASLIWLIELLMKEWYVARESRKQMLATIPIAAAAKKPAPTLAPVQSQAAGTTTSNTAAPVAVAQPAKKGTT